MIIPPKAKKKPYSITMHGHTRIDNYYWLRNDLHINEEIINYLQEENFYTEMVLKSKNKIRKTLYEEMISRIPLKDYSVPYIKNNYRYQTRYEENNEYPIYMRQSVKENSNWNVLLDGNQRAKNNKFYSLESLKVSPDNLTLGVAEDFLSRRKCEIRFKNLTSNNWNNQEILKNTSDSFEWNNNSSSIYYIKKHDKTLLPYQVYRHQIGTNSIQDQLIYEEIDNTFYINLLKTTSKQFILIYISSSTSSEVLLLNADDKNNKITVFLKRRKNHKYIVDHYQGFFYILSNKKGKNFGLYQSLESNKTQWHTIISPHSTTILENFILLKNWIIVSERTKGLVLFRQIDWKTKKEKYIIFNDTVYTAWLAYNPDSETVLLRYGYSSMITPHTIYELNLNNNKQVILKQQKVKNFISKNYNSKRLWITVRDGVQVPVSLVYRRDSFNYGKNPLILYGYGSYGHSVDISFNANLLCLLDRGFVFAIPHVRGGGELGEDWHENGKLLNKKNTFNDFIDVTKSLIIKGYGHTKKIFAIGASAGGLLIGAIINQDPKLFHGVIAKVPFVDVLTTMLDASIPLTTGEYHEWGNPNQLIYYNYIFDYSPYDQVKAKDYPNMLVITGLYDSQVQYWEPVKWVAKLRDMKTDNNQLLLYTHMNSGHSGNSGRFKSYQDVALEYSFILTLI
ncbi:Protease 2 [Candidatus Ecksteinia adelgidicola]|nr:Protease 2 [Candidatus Ecksteinia adelgidicola]